MFRIAIAACLLASPLMAAETKEESCGYQADVMRAVQQARLDRVKEADVADTIAATNPGWPENYNAAIPQLTQFVYSQKMRHLRKEDLGATLREQCLENWDQIQKMQKDLKN
ncbi:hypothetical protein I5535_13675 [Rhodobacteraceae bacterium F11138]|nr:hypothetical protein [Rhodobacteraceae bacterium F11138]